ncbi:MAG: F0F1 ATP synthase subunit A, partial [Chloroflexi bacterium]|nr:F0F1 ATP synthase subunit A [Chloroflexota bacterium]
KSAGLLLPYFRSAMTDLMSTLSLALVGMFMVELWGIRSNGFFSYAGRFFNLGALRRGKFIDFFVGILEIFSEIAKVISFSFRLFGNTLAGEVLIVVFLFLSPLIVGVLPFVFELFFGFIQATVFAILILIFALIATESHESGGEHAHAKAHE